LEIIPSIDLRHGQVVRLRQGDYAQQLNYDVDPIQTAKAFQEAGARWLHVVDLDGAKEGRPVQTGRIAQIIGSTELLVEVGGGIRSEEHIQAMLKAGAQRVVLGTAALENWAWFSQIAHDPQLVKRLILAIDAKDGIVATRGWTSISGRSALDVAREVSDWPLAALLYTDVAKDGMMTGPNFEQAESIARCGAVPVIASGGVGNLDHIRRLADMAVWGAIIGRSLYERKFDLREAILVAAQTEKSQGNCMWMGRGRLQPPPRRPDGG
jgi:phosphoribosylformimino-5-aminoimidazole carboxamide ribotide isomerase